MYSEDIIFFCLECEEYSNDAQIEWVDHTEICPFCGSEDLMKIENTDNYS